MILYRLSKHYQLLIIVLDFINIVYEKAKSTPLMESKKKFWKIAMQKFGNIITYYPIREYNAIAQFQAAKLDRSCACDFDTIIAVYGENLARTL